jgi:hypothetical protein
MAHRFAVVSGGSLAGLMSAKVRAEHFDAVPVLARDPLAPSPRCINRCRRAIRSTGCPGAVAPSMGSRACGTRQPRCRHGRIGGGAGQKKDMWAARSSLVNP